MSAALAPGSEFTVRLDPVELEDAVRYAGAAGDFNPMHYDRELARSKGFRDSFAQGMLTAGLLGGVLVDRFGAAAVRRLAVRFVSPLWRGEAPAVTCRVASADHGVAHLDLSVAAGDRVVLRGTADVAIEPDGGSA